MKQVLALVTATLIVGWGMEIERAPSSVLDLVGNLEIVGWGGENRNGSKPSSPLQSQVSKPLPTKLPPVCRDKDRDGVPDYADLCPDTPKGFNVNHRGCPILLTFPFRVLFDFDKAYVKKIYYPKLKKIATALKHNPYMKIEIAGHTDNRGSRSYNLKLSQNRANRVKGILVTHYHINPTQIVVKGYGETHPLLPNTTSTNRALNRRVEIVDISKEIPPAKLPKPMTGEVAVCSNLTKKASKQVVSGKKIGTSNPSKPISPLLTQGMVVYKPKTSYQKAFGRPHPIDIDQEVIKYSTPTKSVKRVFKRPESPMKHGATPKINVEYIN